MKKIALIYSKNTVNTSKIAQKIYTSLNTSVTIEEINIEEADFEQFTKYDIMVMGAATWFDGELPNFWDEILPGLEDMNFSGKTLALFGLGNSVLYPENFLDAMGILANFFKARGANIIGYTSADGYVFEQSKAYENEKFCGLAVDMSLSTKQLDKQIDAWCKQVLDEIKAL